MGNFVIYTSKDIPDPIIQCSNMTLDLLVAQTAACVIQACSDYPRDGQKPETGIGGILVERMKWAGHVYTNALLTQVEFLYSLVESHLNTRPLSPIFFNHEIVADALSAFQELKNDQCEHTKSTEGVHAGETDYFKKDWTNLNEKLLSQ